MGRIGRWPGGRILYALPALAVLTLAGCGGGDYPQSTFEPITEFGKNIDDIFRIILWWEIGIFVVVEALLLFAVFKFRKRRPEGTPPQWHGHTGLELAWTLAPALILVFIGVPTVFTIFRTQAEPPPESLRVEVIGHQWWWEFRYPDLGVVTANELHLPVDRPVHLLLSSQDVLHSFWLPRLGGKRDCVPGRVNDLWFTPNQTTVVYGQCAEFCGSSHARMKMLAVVESQSDFDAWVASQTVAAPLPTDTLALTGAELFAQPQNLCVTCHTMEGVSQGPVGPNLTHVGSRRTIGSGILENTPENLSEWLRSPSRYKPGVLMPDLGLSDDKIEALVAYLQSRK